MINDIKNKYYISPDNVLIDKKDAINNTSINFYAEIKKIKSDDFVDIFKIQRFCSGANKVFLCGHENISNLFPKQETILRSKALSLSQETCNEELFYDSWTYRGIIDRYLTVYHATPHICIYLDVKQKIRYIKMSIPTIYNDNIYPMIVNIDFDQYLTTKISNNFKLINFLKHEKKLLSKRIV